MKQNIQGNFFSAVISPGLDERICKPWVRT